MLTRVLTPLPSFAHLARLTDERGLFEHALFDVPRTLLGYCVDDVARGLLVTAREPTATGIVEDLTETYLRFIESAIERDGRTHNRMNHAGFWTDKAGLGDWWGRALWALGVTATHAPLPSTRARALDAFSRGAKRLSPHLRAMVFAAIGAGEVLTIAPDLDSARRIIKRTASMIPLSTDQAWPWPELRLRYSNGTIPEALILGGTVLDDPVMTAHGLSLLRFLLDGETEGDHLSVTGKDGRSPWEKGPQFDQQPIEVAALADACARAYDITRDPCWLDGVSMAWNWFQGDNDSGMVMIDVETGAGYDGLTPDGRNENRGAESTLAALSTYQQASRLLAGGSPR